jgi:hypothetical protein
MLKKLLINAGTLKPCYWQVPESKITTKQNCINEIV